MRQPARGRQQQEEGRRRYVPQKQSSPLPMIAGIGGGVFVLIIIIAVAMSSGDDPPPPPPPPPVAAPPANAGGRTVSDTGSILFICANSPSHEDKEVIIRTCACGTRSQFYAEGGHFYCFKCKNAFPSDKLKCDTCGTPARRSRIKH